MRITTQAASCFAILWLLSIMSFGILIADDRQNEKKPAVDEKAQPRTPLTAAECKTLIDQLASRTKPPFAENARPNLPNGIRESDLRRAQQPIRKAYAAIGENIEAALPLLIEHANDQRFSYVYESLSGAYVKASVGATCQRLISEYIEVYRPHVRSFGGSGISGQPPYPRKPEFIDDAGGIEKWWKSRKERSLAELQLETVEWAIRYEKQKGFATPAEESRILPALEDLAAKIRRTSKPILGKAAELFFFGK